MDRAPDNDARYRPRMALDDNGNVVLVGGFQGTSVTFGGTASGDLGGTVNDRFFVTEYTPSGVQEWFQPAFQGWAACVISIDATGVEDEATQLPLEVSLRTNTPNPFRHTTTFHFSLPHETQTSLRVYDPAGRLVRILVSDRLAPGDHRIQWDATGLRSGVYFSRLEAAGFSETRRILLIR